MAVCTLLLAGALAPQPAHALGVRVDLRVLVLTDGRPEVDAIIGALARSGVPTRVVDLRATDRPVVDAAFLADEVAGVPRARFQGVVVPGEADPDLTSSEWDALRSYQRRFGVRQLNASVPATPAVGLADAAASGYIGPFDGGTARVTEEARSEPAFGYLRGEVPFGDETPGEVDNWVEIAAPQPGMRPLLTAQMPGVGRRGALAGVLSRDGHEELSLAFTYGAESIQFQVLVPGLIEWLTQGVHLGIERSWLAVHIDDVLLPNARWIPEHNCAVGADCPETVPRVPYIRMTPDDVAHAVAWQRRNGFQLDLVFNGSGGVAGGSGLDPLGSALVAARDEFGWINHTWSHRYLGCVRDASVTPWECATVPVLGWTRHVGRSQISAEIQQNIDFARRHGLPIDPTELVTGEHGGLRAAPQMPQDNPELAPALDETGVRTIASDASVESGQRDIGAAATVPRHPVNLDFNTATTAEATDRYLWEFQSVADGGSGACERDAGCIPPVDPAVALQTVIIPDESRTMVSHALTNDPRPHYAHQSQLTEDRTLYPLLERVLTTYRSLFTDARPLLIPTLTDTRDVLRRQARWTAAVAAGRVDGWVEGGVVTVVATEPTAVPITVPPGTRLGAADGPEFGDRYGASRSGWVETTGQRQLTMVVRGDA